MQSFSTPFGTILFPGEAVANLLFLLAAIFAAVTSIVLFFHWRRYGMGGTVITFTEIIYLVILVALLGTAFFSIK